MKLEYITLLIGLLVGVVAGLLVNGSGVDHIRAELLTGQVVCRLDTFDQDNQPIFKCKTKKEIDEVVNFLRGGSPNDQRQESRR